MIDLVPTEFVSFVKSLHGDQKYGQKPYICHLMDVVGVYRRFVPLDRWDQDQIMACWAHDVLEDTLAGLADLDVWSERMTGLVWAVTDVKGATRKERKAVVYQKIKANPDALVVKLCDRIANVENCLSKDRVGRPPGPLFKMYLKEHEEFARQLCTCGDTSVTAPMWRYLDSLMRSV